MILLFWFYQHVALAISVREQVNGSSHTRIDWGEKLKIDLENWFNKHHAVCWRGGLKSLIYIILNTQSVFWSVWRTPLHLRMETKNFPSLQIVVTTRDMFEDLSFALTCERVSYPLFCGAWWDSLLRSENFFVQDSEDRHFLDAENIANNSCKNESGENSVRCSDWHEPWTLKCQELLSAGVEFSNVCWVLLTDLMASRSRKSSSPAQCAGVDFWHFSSSSSSS